MILTCLFQMLIELKIEVLEAIVKDGIKEMLGKVAGRQQEKKRSWFRSVKASIVIREVCKKSFFPC